MQTLTFYMAVIKENEKQAQIFENVKIAFLRKDKLHVTCILETFSSEAMLA